MNKTTVIASFGYLKTKFIMEITNKEYLEAKKIVDNYNQQEKIKEENKIKNCKHKNTEKEVSEWHQNGNPDRWRIYCKDCGFIISS